MPENGTAGSYWGNNEDNLTNSTLNVQVEEGLLSFSDVNAFYRAWTIIGNSSDTSFFEWSAENNYESLWEEYTKVLDKFAGLEELSDSILDGFPEGKYQLKFEDGAYMLVPFLKGRALSSLVNSEGMVLIDDQLHYFSDEYHILVATKDHSLMKEVIDSPFSDWSNEKVIVTFQKQGPIELTDDPLAKVQVKFEPCPSEGVAHRETVGKDRLVHEMFTYIFTTAWSSSVVQYNASLRCLLHNYRKKNWSWRYSSSNLRTELNRGGWFNQLVYAGNDPLAGAVFGHGLPVVGANIDQTFMNVATVDNLVAALFTFQVPNLNQQRHFNQGLRFRGLRVSETTEPPYLDITVGCQ